MNLSRKKTFPSATAGEEFITPLVRLFQMTLPFCLSRQYIFPSSDPTKSLSPLRAGDEFTPSTIL